MYNGMFSGSGIIQNFYYLVVLDPKLTCLIKIDKELVVENGRRV